MSTSTNNNRVRVARMPDKVSTKSREDRSILVQNVAANSPIWQANMAVKNAGLALIQAGVDLAAKEKVAQQLAAQAETAQKQIVSLRVTWDETFAVYAGNVEACAVKPEDVTALGLTLLDEQSYKLAPPLYVTARYDFDAALIRVYVKRPPGGHACRVEISPNPIAPGSFQVVKGNGVRRAIAGYPPGGYWVQAATVDAHDQSDYAPPVFVTVP